MAEVQTSDEDPIQIHDRRDFVEKQDVAPGEDHVPAYIIEGKRGYVIGGEQNTPLGPEFRDEDGDKLDPSTRISIVKTDSQGNPLGNAIVFQGNLDQFNYDEMRSDPDFIRTTDKSFLLDERQYLHIYVDIPNGTSAFSAEMSRFTLGDNVTQTGKPVFVRDKDNMGRAGRAAAGQASGTGGNGNGE